jgi:modification methylase
VILSSSKPGDVVLDPFFGTGTTGAVRAASAAISSASSARKDLCRARAGAPRGGRSVAVAVDRAVHDRARSAAGAVQRAARTRPDESRRPPHGRQEGTVKALVRADGTIALGGENVGSIHRIGAIAQGLEACNGWTYWHVESG